MSTGGLLEQDAVPAQLTPSGVTGAALVGLGAVLSGGSAYLFLVITARHLGPEKDAALSALWSLAFLAGPGFFLPFEQEVARLVSVRTSGESSRKIIEKAAVLGTIVVAVLITIALLLAAAAIRRLFDGQPLLFVGFLLTLPGYLCMHLAWGLLAGSKRLASYALVTATEGLVRVVIGAGLVFSGVRSAGPFGLALGIAPFAAAATAVLRRQRPAVTRPGDEIETSAMTFALLALLGASLLNQLLLMGGPIAVKLMARTHDPATGRLLDGMVLIRVPLFLFNAVLAALLPRLASLSAEGRREEFLQVVRNVTLGVLGISALLVIAAGTVAPAAVVALFGPGYRLGGPDLAVLAAASAAYMLALTFSQGLIARSDHLLTTAAWALGVSTFALVIVLGARLGLLGRVEWGFFGGSIGAAVTMWALLRLAVRPNRWSDTEASLPTPRVVPIADLRVIES